VDGNPGHFGVRTILDFKAHSTAYPHKHSAPSKRLAFRSAWASFNLAREIFFKSASLSIFIQYGKLPKWVQPRPNTLQ
jgi:hypothetical protein